MAANETIAKPADRATDKPNIVVIWGYDNPDDIECRTPNIDRVSRDGALFTDWYGQEGRAAGRAAFISGQSPNRTSLTDDPTIAEFLEHLGYVCGRFGTSLDSALDFIERQHIAATPFFCWWDSARQDTEGVVQHDAHVGHLLDQLEALGIADGTLVICSTHNGDPDGRTTWEDGWRVPTAIRWPGHVEPGTISHMTVTHVDMLPTLLAAAGEPDIVEKAKHGVEVGNRTVKVVLDGYNLLSLLQGEVDDNPRPGFLYWSDDGDLVGLRWGNGKFQLQG